MSHDDLRTMIRRNKLVGIWAAEKLGLVGESAEVYSNDLAMGALYLERGDVFGKISSDFQNAGVVQSDEEIRRVMNDCWLQAAGQSQTDRGNASDAAVIQIARNLEGNG